MCIRDRDIRCRIAQQQADQRGDNGYPAAYILGQKQFNTSRTMVVLFILQMCIRDSGNAGTRTYCSTYRSSNGCPLAFTYQSADNGKSQDLPLYLK